MNINSIDRFYESSLSRERLKHRGQGVQDRHVAESNVSLKNSYEDISGRVMNDDNSAALNFSGIEKLLGKKWVGKVLTSINEHHQASNAVVAFIMAGILRPLFTMKLKVDEKKDKINAAFHSISSAILGLLVTLGVTIPIDNAVNKTMKNPNLYKADETNAAVQGAKKGKSVVNTAILDINKEIEILKSQGLSANSKEIKHLVNKKGAIELIAKNFPEWLICVPRAMLTVALIPVFMKGISSLQDKLSKKQEMQPAVVVNNVPQKTEQINNGKQDVNFKGFSDIIAKKLVIPFMNSKFVTNVADKMADNKGFLYDTMQMVASFAISTTYAVRSYRNTKIDDNEKNRKILALNHFTTWVISTAISLLTLKRLGSWWQRKPMAKLILQKAEFANETLKDGFLKGYAAKQAEKLKNAKKVEGFFERYKAKNDARRYSALEYFRETNPNVNVDKELEDMLEGLNLSQRQLVWGTVTRLIVPLCSTIIASKVGRKVINRREAKQEALQQAEQQKSQQENSEKAQKLAA